MMQAKRLDRGFTFIEMVVVITILAVILAIAVPSAISMIRSQGARTAAYDLYANLVYARSEAVKRNQSITVAATSTSSASWQNGWTVKRGSTTLRDESAHTRVLVCGDAASLVYSSAGRISSGSGSFEIKSDDGNNTRCLTVDPAGMPRVRTGACTVTPSGC